MSAKNKGIITGSLVLTLVIGTMNSVYKNDKLPSFRFFFGSGILYLFLLGIGEFEEEISKSIAIAIAVFTVLGEGGGMLGHFLGAGGTANLDTQPIPPTDKASLGARRSYGGSSRPDIATLRRRDTGINTVEAYTGTFPVKPVIPNAIVANPI